MKNILILLFFAQIASAQTDISPLKASPGSITFGQAAGDGVRFCTSYGSKGALFISFATGNNTVADSVVFTVKNENTSMFIGPAVIVNPDNYLRDLNKFYVVKTNGGFAVMSNGRLPEFTDYNIKITFEK